MLAYRGHQLAFEPSALPVLPIAADKQNPRFSREPFETEADVKDLTRLGQLTESREKRRQRPSIHCTDFDLYR